MTQFTTTTERLLVAIDVAKRAHEDLRINDIVRQPKPVLAETPGEYLPNGACWKSKLNKSTGDAGWGTCFRF
jgi:hypothetical protein